MMHSVEARRMQNLKSTSFASGFETIPETKANVAANKFKMRYPPNIHQRDLLTFLPSLANASEDFDLFLFAFAIFFSPSPCLSA